jgi:phage tail tape-measure protein
MALAIRELETVEIELVSGGKRWDTVGVNLGKAIMTSGGAWAGAQIGAEIGAIGGPVGGIVGGLIGLVAGTLLTSD